MSAEWAIGQNQSATVAMSQRKEVESSPRIWSATTLNLGVTHLTGASPPVLARVLRNETTVHLRPGGRSTDLGAAYIQGGW